MVFCSQAPQLRAHLAHAFRFPQRTNSAAVDACSRHSGEASCMLNRVGMWLLGRCEGKYVLSLLVVCEGAGGLFIVKESLYVLGRR